MVSEAFVITQLLSNERNKGARDADVVLAEDTRHSRKLLNHLGIQRHLISYHAHNERKREAFVLSRLRYGHSVAVISDAGNLL